MSIQNHHPLRRIEIMSSLQIRRDAIVDQVVNNTSDLCRFLKEPLYEPFGQLVYQSMARNTQNVLFRKCPIPVGMYCVRDFMIDLKMLPYLSDLEFVIRFEMFTFRPQRVWMCGIEVNGAISRVRRSSRRGGSTKHWRRAAVLGCGNKANGISRLESFGKTDPNKKLQHFSHRSRCLAGVYQHSA